MKKYKINKSISSFITIPINYMIVILLSLLLEPVISKAENATPNTTEVLVYSKDFAKKVSLDPTKAINLDPGIYAIAIILKKEYHFAFLAGNSFVEKYHLDDLTPEEAYIFDNHLEVLPIIFKGTKLPLFTTYKCSLNLYLNSNDIRVKNLKMPPVPFWSIDIDPNFISPIAKPIYSKTIKNNNTSQSKDIYDQINYYFNSSYPEGVLAKSAEDLASGSNSIYSPLNYESDFREIIPGVTFISYKATICSSIADVGDKDGTRLWIEKKDGANYNDYQFHGYHGVKYNSHDFYPFKIPAEITNSPALNTAIKHNIAQSYSEFSHIFPLISIMSIFK